MADIAKLSRVCRRIDEIDDEKRDPEDKNFYAVNMHGYELAEDFVVPAGIRLIMFCYSGKILNICPRFDKYNWEKIFTDSDATYNYCTFLSSLAGYSTLRNHFCVYNEGDVIKNMKFKTDEYFRHGVFSLPVHAAVMDWDANVVYGTSEDATEHAMSSRPEQLQMDSATSIRTDKKKASALLKDKHNPAVFLSSWSMPINVTLENMVRQIKFRNGGGTILLLTCREGKPQKLKHAPRVLEEIERMYTKYRSASSGI